MMSSFSKQLCHPGWNWARREGLAGGSLEAREEAKGEVHLTKQGTKGRKAIQCHGEAEHQPLQNWNSSPLLPYMVTK